MSAPNEELLDFFAQGQMIFGPTTRGRIQIADHVARFNFSADPNWTPPAKRFQDTRNVARSNKRSSKNG